MCRLLNDKVCEKTRLVLSYINGRQNTVLSMKMQYKTKKKKKKKILALYLKTSAH